MIEDSKYSQILNDGLLLDHYFLLCKIHRGEKLVQSKRIQGFINLLVKKEYIVEDKLSEKALILLEHVELVQDGKVQEISVVRGVETDFWKWLLGLHERLQNKIFELTGKRQVTAVADFNGGKRYPFLPNKTDLEGRIHSVYKAYSLGRFNLDRIEDCLIRYIEHCHQRNNWFPVLDYYISRRGKGSVLVTDLENFDDSQDGGFKSSQKLL